MAHTMSDARIALDGCNQVLEDMGIEPLYLQKTNDGGRGSRRVMFSDNHEASYRCTPNELCIALDLLERVLRKIR